MPSINRALLKKRIDQTPHQNKARPLSGMDGGLCFYLTCAKAARTRAAA
jgi:hypothetical protein